MPTVRVIVKGRVQGVFYRQSTRERARALSLSGWVRNLPDGTVELQASGNRETLESLIEWCRSGPPAAKVETLNVDWLEHEGKSGESGFHIW